MQKQQGVQDWLQRIGHHLSVRLNDGRAIAGFLLTITDDRLEIREAEPGEWNSLGGEHITFTFSEMRVAFDNSVEELVDLPAG